MNWQPFGAAGFIVYKRLVDESHVPPAFLMELGDMLPDAWKQQNSTGSKERPKSKSLKHVQPPYFLRLPY